MKTLVPFIGTSKAIKNSIGKDSRIKYPSQFWTTDTKQYGYLTPDGELKLVGIPQLNGTLVNPIVISELESGVYQVTGQHKIDRSEKTVYLSGVPVIYQVSKSDTKTKIKRITASDIMDIVITSEGITKETYVTDEWLKDNNYITSDNVDVKLQALEASLKQGARIIASDVFDEKIDGALEERIKEVGQSNINKLFE